MSLQKKLDNMVGKTFMYRTTLYKVVNFKIEDTTVDIVTDRKWFTFALDTIDSKLDEFLPVEDEAEEENKSLAVVSSQNLALYNQVKDDLPDLRKTVKNNIEKLATDKSFIPQAVAINESINSMVNLLKLEMQILKLKNGKIK